MKKLTLLLAAAMISVSAFAGDGKDKACCKKDGDKNAKACCQKEASSAKACCKKDGEKTAKAEDTKSTTTASRTSTTTKSK